MKILHVNKFFDLHGGAETYIHALMERQRAAGHDVHAFSTRSSGNLPSADANRFVERFNYAVKEGFQKDIRKGLSFLWNQEAERAMDALLRELRPDVVHLHNIYHHLSTSILSPIRALKIPCVQTLHDYKLACPNYKMFTEGSPCERCKGGRYYEAVIHHCLTPFASGNILAAAEMGFAKAAHAYERTVKMFISPSQFLADKMISWGEPSSKFSVIRFGVDVPDAQATSDGGYILTVGRLSSEKGLDTLIRAAARVPDLKLKIAGIGSEEARLHMLATSLGAENVEFLGFIRRTDRPDVWLRAMALAVPSIWYENAPLAVHEAMSDGLPILASRIGGLPELVRHGENGLLAEPHHTDAWTSMLRTFTSLTKEERDRMGHESRRRIGSDFQWSAHLTAIHYAYSQAGATG